MYMDNQLAVLNSGDFSHNHAYGVGNRHVMVNSSQPVVFVNPPAISSRFSPNKPLHDSHSLNSGNAMMGSNIMKSVNQQLVYRLPPRQTSQCLPVQSLNSSRMVDSHPQQSVGPFTTLNKLSQNIGSQGHESIPRFYNVHQRQGFFGRVPSGDSQYHGHAAYDHRQIANGYERTSPKDHLDGYQTRFSKSLKMRKNDSKVKGLRKRNRSDTSTESQESRGLKFQKTSEDSNPSGMRKIPSRGSFEPNYRHRHRSKSPECQDQRNSYNMTRLDLGPSIERSRGQQELESRLKAMNHSIDNLSEAQAIVVPSLPSILSLHNL